MGAPWNPEQLQVLELHMQLMTTGETGLVRIEGGAATGKSSLLLEVAERTRLFYKDPQSVLLVALTNTAADAVGGRTFHSALMLAPGESYAPIDDDLLYEICQGFLQAVRVVVIDNSQQANRHVLHAADRRLREFALEGKGDSPFGGRIVLAFGDSSSWGPVPPGPGELNLDAGLDGVLDTFSPTIELSECFFDEESFAEAVERLRQGIVTIADHHRYAERRLGNMSLAERRGFEHAPRVYASRAAADSFTQIYRTQHPPAPGANTYTRATRRDPLQITLWPGAAVVLTSTLPRADAGSLGVVREANSAGVTVHLVGTPESAPITLPGHALPLAHPSGYTVPTAMGLRFDRVVVSLPDNEWGEMTFVYAAISRAKGWENLAFEDFVPKATMP